MIYVFSNKEKSELVSIEYPDEFMSKAEGDNNAESKNFTNSTSLKERAASIFASKINTIRQAGQIEEKEEEALKVKAELGFSLYWSKRNPSGPKLEIVNIVWNNEAREFDSSGELVEILKAQGKSSIDIMRESLEAISREILLSSLTLVK